MPELPEVETVRRVLFSEILNLNICNVRLFYKPIFENNDQVDKLINNKFIDIKRKGKYLIFVLAKGFLLSHLRMEGKYFYLDSDTEINKHMHVAIDFSNGKSLIYQDVRKFGRMHYYETLADLEADLDLGPDANRIQDIDSLYLKMKKSNLPIKSLLLDQSFIAGLGNIYVDEVLYRSHIFPNLKAKSLTKDDLNNISINAKEILDKAIINKGTTIRSYTSSLGVTGNYQNFLAIHTKATDACGHHVYKMKIGGRTSYFCPLCESPRRKLVIGLTGGIASGKSNISKELRDLGFVVADADKYAHEAYNDPIILNEVKKSFSDAFVGDLLDLKLLAKIIFNDEKKRDELNKLIHPYVIKCLERDISNNELIFLDIPLLFEAKLEYLCDKIICAYLDKDLEVERLMNRDNIDREYAYAKINAQLPLETKKAKSNYVVDTSGDFSQTKNNLLEVLTEIFSSIE